ncbi:MAG: hypothetical protein ACAI18_11390, partial [Gemmatimonadales bacterium]
MTQPLYDPNFRANDVEGYRIYRGRVDNPSELVLLAQFDQAPDAATGKGLFLDFRGLLNPDPGCAPELTPAVLTTCDPAIQPPPPVGTPFTSADTVDLVGTVTQVTPGNRVLLASGEAQILPGTLDTAFAEVTAGRLGQGVTTELGNTGVPFIFVDRGVRNSLRYFYAVTAFDVNSLVSGPSSLESARVSKAVIPAPTPSNQTLETSVAPHVVGRDNVATDTLFSMPTIDPATGRFSGPMPPANGGVVEFVGEFAGAVIQPDQGGELSMRLDSMTAGQWNTTVCCAVGSPGFPSTYYLTLKSPTDSFKVTAPLDLTYTFPGPDLVADSTFYQAVVVKPEVAQKYEGASSTPFTLSAFGAVQLPAPGVNGGWGLGCFAGDITALVGSTVALNQCPYNGSRWFEGPSPEKNETMADPNGGNCIPNAGGSTATLAATGTCNLTAFNNAGQLPGVDVIQQALEYVSFNGQWRNAPWFLGTVHRGADYNVYWGTGGLIDSVIDVSHNVVVPFSPTMGNSWGLLNGTNAGTAGGLDLRPTVLTMTDIGCVEPFKSQFGVAGSTFPGMAGRIPCTGGTAALENTAGLSNVALFKDVPANAATAPVS